MSGTQKVNKLSRKSKKKSATSQAKSLNVSMDDFSKPKSQRVEKKSEIFSSGKIETPISVQQQKPNSISPKNPTVNPITAPKPPENNDSSPKPPENRDSSPKPPENHDSSPKPPENSDSAAVANLADCPMCGKLFKPGLVAQRNSHLKSCGNKNGMRTDKLVELRRLEERQAEERAALGFHIIPNNQNVEKPPKRVQRKNKQIAKDGGADADLELALALSISAQSGGENKLLEKQVVSSATEALKCSQNDKGPMWLPQAPVPQKKRGRKKIVGNTVLQTRSEAERGRLVGDKVAAIVYPEVEDNPQLDRIRRATLPERKENDRLSSLEDPEMIFWSLAALPKTAKNEQFMADKLENYIDVKQLGDCSDEKENKTTDIVEKSNCNDRILDEVKKSVQPSLKHLSDEWLDLFKSQKRTDLKILCRDEEVVHCHHLVLEVRCPKILNDTVKEASNGKEEEIVIWSHFDHKVVSVMMEFLYCGVLNISVIETVEELIQLKQIATFNEIGDIIEILKEVKIEEAHDNDITGGFCEEGEERYIPTATQNLDALLDCLDNSEKDGVENIEDNDCESVEEEDWDEVCEFMTQKVKKSVDNLDEPEEDLQLNLSESDDSIFDEEQDEVNKTSTPVKSKTSHSESLEKLNSPEASKCAKMTISRASSPDMFGSDNDDEDDIIETDWNLPQNITNHDHIKPDNNSSKRKSQLLDDSVNWSFKKRRTISPNHPTSPEMHPIYSPVHPISPEMHLISSPVRPISSIHPISPVRLNFCNNSNELPTPNKSRINSKTSSSKTKFNDEEEEVGNVIDLTQRTPTPPNIISSNDSEKIEENDVSPKNAIYLASNSPISVKSSGSQLPSQNSPKSVVDSPKSSYSPSKSITTTPKSSKSITTTPKSPLVESTTTPKSSSVNSNSSTIMLINKLVQDLSDANIDNIQTEACLKSLCDVEVSVPMMLDTGVGKVVRKLRDREGRIGRMAGRLVARWKKLIFAYNGPEVVRDSQELTQSPGKVTSKDEEIVTEEPVIVNENEEVNTECEIEENDNVWENDLGDLCDLGDDGDKDSSYEEIEQSFGEIARLQMEDSAIWRSENEPSPVSPQAHVTPHRAVQSIKKSAKPLLTPRNRPKNATPLRIQSLKNSAIKSATPKNGNSATPENENPFMTPENVRNRRLPDATPMGDYDMMLTPELRDELHRFGLKAVPRRKAVQLLQFIYDKTHPFVDKENSSPFVAAKNSPKPNSISKSKMKTSAKKVRIAHQPSTSKSIVNSNIKKPTNCSPKTSGSGIHLIRPAEDDQSGSSQMEFPEDDGLNLSQASTCSNHSQAFDVPEESIMEMEDEDEDEITASQMPTEGSLWTQLRSFIHSKPDLHHSILIFEPIWLKQFVALVKQAGIKCKIAQVMDFLDHECITFRTETNRVNRQKKKSSPKKKTKKSPLKTKSPIKKGGRKKREN